MWIWNRQHSGSRGYRSREVGSPEYDPDDLGIDEPRRPLVSTAGLSAGGGIVTQRMRVSAITELKEFVGKDNDEDRARG